jgi:hypothetical protein
MTEEELTWAGVAFGQVNFVRLSGWVEWLPKHDSGFNG